MRTEVKVISVVSALFLGLSSCAPNEQQAAHPPTLIAPTDATPSPTPETPIMLTQYFEFYKQAFILPEDGGAARVIMPEGYYLHSGATISESQSYGLLFTAKADDPAAFASLLKYQLQNEIAGLEFMHWYTSDNYIWCIHRISPDTNNPYCEAISDKTALKKGVDFADDAEIDYFLALVEGAKKWGNVQIDNEFVSLGKLATDKANNILLNEYVNIPGAYTDPSSGQERTLALVKPWYWWDGKPGSVTSFDRFDPQAYLLMFELTGNPKALDVYYTQLLILERFLANNPQATRLPDWIAIEGTLPDTESASESSYDASRVLLRLAKIPKEQRPPIVQEIFNRYYDFYRQELAIYGTISDIYDIYGKRLSDNQAISMYISALLIAKDAGDAELEKEILALIQQVSQYDRSYFSDSLALYFETIDQ